MQITGHKSISFSDPVNFEEYTDPIRCPHGGMHVYEMGTLKEKIEEGVVYWQCALSGQYFPKKEFKTDPFALDAVEKIRQISDLYQKEEKRREKAEYEIKELQGRINILENQVLAEKEQKIASLENEIGLLKDQQKQSNEQMEKQKRDFQKQLNDQGNNFKKQLEELQSQFAGRPVATNPYFFSEKQAALAQKIVFAVASAGILVWTITKTIASVKENKDD